MSSELKLIQQVNCRDRRWFYAPVFAFLAVLIAAVCWSLKHAYGVHWDEAAYLNDSYIDTQRLLSGDLLRLGGRILIKSWGRPPGFRILALPFLTLFGLHITVARLVSLSCYAVSALFIYLATTRVASSVAGALAALVFLLSPEVVSASIFFGTDAPLYLATSAMLYFLFECWSDSGRRSENEIGLGLAIGLGFLSKTSFLAIFLPVLALWFVLSRWGSLGVPSLGSKYKAFALASLVAIPWWLFNFRTAFEYSRYARGFVRNSLGAPSPITYTKWLNSVLQCLLGHGVSILIALVVFSWFRTGVLSGKGLLAPLQKKALLACVCAGLPIVLAQLSGTNHLLRHISPAMVPLAIAVGILANQTQWISARSFAFVSGTLLLLQLVMLAFPVIFPNKRTVDLGFVNGSLPWRTMVRFDQWDWRPLQDITDSCGLDTPKLSYLGNGRAFNPPQIETPWIKRRTGLPDVAWLWRYEDGPLDWQKVMVAAGRSDVVMTAPHFAGEARYKEDLDNQFNVEFAERISQDATFRGPVRLEMGRFEPIEVDVFLKKSLVCKASQRSPSAQQ